MKVNKFFMVIFIVTFLCISIFSYATGAKESNGPAKSMMIEKVTLTDEKPSGDLEIYSWWAGDEGPALQALIDLYKKNNPNVNVINATVTGGSGVNARAVLKTRMLGGDPPSTFQVHAGQELIGTWVTAERMLDLTPLFEKAGWLNVMPKDLIDNIGSDGGIWSVPVNIHRSNILWNVPANLKKWGVTAPNSWDEFLTIAEKLKSQGVIPLSLAQNWTVNHLWESVALGVLGADKYNKLWTGELAFTSPEAVRIWSTLDKVLKYTNQDAASLSWQQATDMVVKGQAAFNVMGDWAAGYMSTTLKLKPLTGFGWSASPGTNGVFMFLADSFGYPKGAKNSAAVLAWLDVCGSKAGQDAFNPLKGSIPARTDADKSKYNAYAQSAMADFAKNKIVGSLAHGVVANEGFMNDFATVMEIFLDSRSAQQASNAAQAIANQNGIGK